MRYLAALAVLGLLVSCGADGEPVPPKLSSTHTIGVNSETGVFNRSTFTLFFGGDASSS
ncbi:MAG: hypothetical protein P8L68_08190 [Paracoccaceae bacterium]|nr:hypothetical protein [Paracoccaceae bacterium]MDG2258459.1 hypothetical protein [Paracoccaceae bacterium]